MITIKLYKRRVGKKDHYFLIPKNDLICSHCEKPIDNIVVIDYTYIKKQSKHNNESVFYYHLECQSNAQNWGVQEVYTAFVCDTLQYGSKPVILSKKSTTSFKGDVSDGDVINNAPRSMLSEFRLDDGPVTIGAPVEDSPLSLGLDDLKVKGVITIPEREVKNILRDHQKAKPTIENKRGNKKNVEYKKKRK